MKNVNQGCYKIKDYDPAKLKADLSKILQDEWKLEAPFTIEGFFSMKTEIFHDGGWKGLALHQLGGIAEHTDPGGPSLEEFEFTPLIHRMEYIKEILQDLDLKYRSVRLSYLAPNTEIKEHCDTYHHFRYGQVRLHLPILTNRKVELYIDNYKQLWSEGELWYGNFSKPHRVANFGDSSRVHLLIDAEVDEKLIKLIAPELIGEHCIYYRPRVELSEPVLKSLQRKFVVSAALIEGFFNTDEGIPGMVDGEIVFEHHDLYFCVDKRRLFKLIPVSDNEFKFAGWTSERIVKINRSSVELVIRHGPSNTTIQLSLI